MANNATGFFYWYRRYKVRAVDMNAFQVAMVETARALGEGVMGAAVLRGFSVAPASGFSLAVNPGIANAASGYLEVMNDAVVLDASAAVDPSLPCRSLVVATPDLVDDNFINSPTVPASQVPLNQLQKATVQLIVGTPGASPEYPAKGANDVILAGIIAPAGATSITQSMLDYEVRDSIGKNSLIGQNQVRFDDRMRPYRSAAKILGIKPSQNVGSSPFGFSYPGRLTPSLFPLNAGSFNPQDTFVDFSTGAISGGDSTTPAFTPVVPTANNSVICMVTLAQNDTLRFNFGDPTGTYAQCVAAIQNQQFTGPGSMPVLDGNFGIAYAIITSFGGAIADIQVLDGRPFLGSGAAAAKFTGEIPVGLVNGANANFTLSTVPADPGSIDFYIDENVLELTDFTISGKVITITNPDRIPQLAQSVYVKYLVFGAVSNNAGSAIPTARFKQETPAGDVDGINDSFALSTVPVDPESLDFYVDDNKLETTDYTLTGTIVKITNVDRIPALAQSVYAKYLYLGVILGGGSGGGGTSGYTAFGSRTIPQVISASVGIAAMNLPLQTWFVRSSSGAQVVTANPQIAVGSQVGQVIKIKAPNGSNYPVFQDGNGLSLNGIWPVTGQPAPVVQDSSIELTWDGLVWSEDSRR